MASPIFPNEKPTRSLSEFEFLHDPTDKASKLGVGSFASVKLVREKDTGKKYALKIISMDPAKLTASDLHNIKMEITIHRKLNHPNIVKFHDYIQKDNQMHFLLDYAETGNLYSYIHKRKSLPPADIFRFFHQACLAIQYLHDNDILHRDIKPENLLIDKDLNIKLCDFGWSTRKIHEKRTTFCGTYEYMAPEIVYKKTYDYRVDIWSLGVLLFELIHREAPYKGRSLSEISQSLSKGKINFSSTIDPEAKDLILRILKSNPEERLTVVQILAHPWVKSQLNEDINISHISDEKLSLKEISSYHFPSTDDEGSKHIVHQEKENSKSETVITEENKVPKQAVSPLSIKRPNVQIFSSFSGTITSREKEQEKLKERERLREKLLSLGTENTLLGTSDLHKRKPSTETFSSLPLKSIDQNNSSNRGHIKASSSLNSNVLERIISEAKKAPHNPSKNKKIFENSIISPNFKTKINTIIDQLSCQTTMNKQSSNPSSFFNSKDSTHRSDHYATLSSTQRSITKQISADAQLSSSRVKSKTRKDDEGSSGVLNLHKVDGENTKRGNIQLHRKNDSQPKLSTLKDEDNQNVPSPTPKTRKVSKPKLIARSPEPVIYKVSLINSSHKPTFEKTLKTPLGKSSDRVLSANNQNNPELNSIANNINRTMENKKKHGLIFGESLTASSNKIFLALNDKREDKDFKKDIVRDKENQAIFKEATLRNWAA